MRFSEMSLPIIPCYAILATRKDAQSHPRLYAEVADRDFLAQEVQVILLRVIDAVAGTPRVCVFVEQPFANLGCRNTALDSSSLFWFLKRDALKIQLALGCPMNAAPHMKARGKHHSP